MSMHKQWITRHRARLNLVFGPNSAHFRRHPRTWPDLAAAKSMSDPPQNLHFFLFFGPLTVFFAIFHIFLDFSERRNGPLVGFLRGYIKACRPLVDFVKSLILQVRGGSYCE